jgi:hypothetical protein
MRNIEQSSGAELAGNRGRSSLAARHLDATGMIASDGAYPFGAWSVPAATAAESQWLASLQRWQDASRQEQR